VCLVAVSSVVVAQGPPPAGERLAPPVWFLQKGLTGPFSERTAVCRDVADSTPSSPTLILVPKAEPAEICINFPPRTLPDGRKLNGGWRHDIGVKGACANDCCSFNPPTKQVREPVDHPAWFESVDCSTPTEIFKAPFLFQGQNGDAKSLCVEVDGAYQQVSGQLSNCSPSSCCILYEEA
jgi:hypothetical protein